MSYGLVCLTCRKYVVPKGAPNGCQCETPDPSWDAKTPIGRTCHRCGKPSPVMTLCDPCDFGPSMMGGTAIPWPEMEEYVFGPQGSHE